MTNAAQRAQPSLRYKEVDLPFTYVGGPTELLSAQGSGQRKRKPTEQRLLLKFRWPLQAPLTGKATCRFCRFLELDRARQF